MPLRGRGPGMRVLRHRRRQLLIYIPHRFPVASLPPKTMGYLICATGRSSQLLKVRDPRRRCAAQAASSTRAKAHIHESRRFSVRGASDCDARGPLARARV